MMNRKLIIQGLFIFLMMCMIYSAQAAGNVLSFSQESGFYKRMITLEMNCSQQDARIYYTLDGTAPDEEDSFYSAPLQLNMTVGRHDPLSQIGGVNIEEDFVPMKDFPSAHVIRARALLPDGTWTEETCGTYFIGYDREKLYGNLPVISLMMDAEDLFNYENGIYVLGKVFDEWNAKQTEFYEVWELTANYTGRGMEWEREVMVDFMMGEGDQFAQRMGVRIKGGASRSGTQKNLRLIARDDYGEKNMKYPFFPDNYREYDGKLLQKYKSVTLRAGGNDRDFGRIRDPLIANLSTGLAFETANNRPVIGFVNGEFWGIYTLNEEYNDNYIQYHYDIDNENVITYKIYEVDDGTEEDADLYWYMHYYILQHDMADPRHFEKAAELLDMQSFADYVALHLYIYNQDGIFQHNNWEAWRVREPEKEESPLADGKWRMMLYDTDFSSGVYEDGLNYEYNNIIESLNADYDEWHPGRLVQALMKSETFRGMLISSLTDIRNLYFHHQRVEKEWQRLKDQYSPYMAMTYRRFGPMWVAQWDPEGHSNFKMDTILTFFRGRYGAFENLMKDAFQLNNTVTITVKTKGEGHVLINGRNIPVTHGQKLYYFTDVPITITAVPGEGKEFTGWKTSNQYAQLADPQAETTTVTFSKAFTITADFD